MNEQKTNEAPMVALINASTNVGEAELRELLKKVREVRKVPSKRKAAVKPDKDAVALASLEHLL